MHEGGLGPGGQTRRVQAGGGRSPRGPDAGWPIITAPARAACARATRGGRGPARAGCRRRMRRTRSWRRRWGGPGGGARGRMLAADPDFAADVRPAYHYSTSPGRAGRTRARSGRMQAPDALLAAALGRPGRRRAWLQRHDSAGDASGLVRKDRRQSNTRTCLAVISQSSVC